MTPSDITAIFAVLIFIVGIPMLAARIGWKKHAHGRSVYFIELFFWWFIAVLLGAFAGAVPPESGWALRLGALLGGLLGGFFAGWKISKSIGSRLRDMGWPRWTCVFAGLPIVWLVALFWPPSRQRREDRKTAESEAYAPVPQTLLPLLPLSPTNQSSQHEEAPTKPAGRHGRH